MNIIYVFLTILITTTFSLTSNAESSPVPTEGITVYDIIDTYIVRKDLYDEYYKDETYKLNAYVTKIEKSDGDYWKLYFNDNMILKDKYDYQFTCEIKDFYKNRITKNKSKNDKIYVNVSGKIDKVVIQKPETHVDYETRTLELSSCRVNLIN